MKPIQMKIVMEWRVVMNRGVVGVVFTGGVIHCWSCYPKFNSSLQFDR